VAPSSGSSYHDEIWASVPVDRCLDEAAQAWALATVAQAGARPRVLDLGCGDGRISGALAAAGAEVTGLDASEVALERARGAHSDLQFMLPAEDGSLPFADGSFDVVVCLNVLEHVPDTQRLMSEARRVMAPGGRIAVAVPFHGRIAGAWSAFTAFERVHDPLEPTLRFYTRRSLAALLTSFGYGAVVLAAGGGVPLFRRTLLARGRR
jgi:2-polyprenyl-3-methyl-5-hydroxy-6-metoxy-1,4-benzoquinol methylase